MRTISTSACVADGPAIETARSPDSRVSRNASVITVNATSRPRTRRRAIRRNIYKTPVPASTQCAFSVRRSKRNGVTKLVSRAREPEAFHARACVSEPWPHLKDRFEFATAMTAMCMPTYTASSPTRRLFRAKLARSRKFERVRHLWFRNWAVRGPDRASRSATQDAADAHFSSDPGRQAPACRSIPRLRCFRS